MDKIAEFYKALGDKTRLQILKMLSTQEMCVNEISDRLNKSQPAISHHLKILKQAGLIVNNRDGKWIKYCINVNAFENILQGENEEVIKSYAQPIQRVLENLNPEKNGNYRQD
ncbi:ArsR/SmtB family transcription factor [Desulfoscipio geothermicus]|uniref:ArsR family transcriptional regulator n=1 Tax=Desulfoscipio geothermicus DSM 3669 TaxID=1121426 RepID=A0A1I6E081_9FIRM|nr:metalloregulator ArsR/SmtB family transcription factor [Desulfoscipio geothermicus]SFR11123.1 ArsR family transcriptional regulator [Desulfoscipio geothermicus DSM 3669]